MDIDWSKAPEGATHFNPHSKGFMKISGYDVFLWVEQGDRSYWMRSRGKFGGFDVRPNDGIPRPTEWNGSGLPPVGLVCEMRRTDYVDVDWQKVEFLCAGNKKAFFRDKDGYEWSRPLGDLKFRPIRTPEQIAAEERERGILQMAHDCGWWWKTETDSKCLPPVFAAMWKAGYRKFEITDE